MSEKIKTSKPFKSYLPRQSNRKLKNHKSKKENKPIPVIFATTPLQGNFIDVLILGKTINTLVDTGSSLSCIHKSLLESLDQDFITYGKSDYRKVKRIGGNLIDISGIAILPLQIGDHKFYQKFYIFDDILHPLLSGIDFLQANKCTLNFENQTIDTEEGEPVVNILNPIFNMGLARPVRHTVIQPHSETVFPIRISRVPNKETVMFEPVNLLTKKKLAGAKSIIKVNKGRRFCKVLNPLSSPVPLKPWHVIGRLVSICTDSITEYDTETANSEPSVASGTCSKENEINDLTSKYQEYKKTVDDLGISLDESDLTEEQKMKLFAFIASNRNSFTKDTSELGCTNFHQHRIETGNAPPQRKRPYRVSPQIKQHIDEQIEDMLKNDITEPSNNLLAAPVVMCKKKDNTYRFAVDYQDLNAVTKPIIIPLPRLEDVIDSVGENN